MKAELDALQAQAAQHTMNGAEADADAAANAAELAELQQLLADAAADKERERQNMNAEVARIKQLRIDEVKLLTTEGEQARANIEAEMAAVTAAHELEASNKSAALQEKLRKRKEAMQAKKAGAAP